MKEEFDTTKTYLAEILKSLKERPENKEEPEMKNESALEQQVGGDHYKKLGEYQPWMVMKKWLTPEEFRGAIKATASIYLCRENDKGGRQDIKKAYHTLGIYLELTKEQDE